MKNLRIIIADDSQIFRETAIDLFDGNDQCEIIAEAENGWEAYKLSESLMPDIILMDFSMPNMDGLKSIQLIKRKNPKVKIIAISVHNDEYLIKKMIQSGADHFIPKTEFDPSVFDYIEKLNLSTNSH